MLHPKIDIETHIMHVSRFTKLRRWHLTNVLCIINDFLLFSVLELFDMSQRSEVVVCTENDHCQLKCTGKPKCEPHAACDVTWYQGSGTQRIISSSESTAIDLEG